MQSSVNTQVRIDCGCSRLMSAHSSGPALAHRSSVICVFPVRVMSAPALPSGASSAAVAGLARAIPISEVIELSCPVCLEQYDHGRVLVQRPLVAGCGHTLCSRCVGRLANGAAHFHCPMCRAQSAVDLPINFAFIALLSAIAPAEAPSAGVSTLSFAVSEANKPTVQLTMPADISLDQLISTVCKQLAPQSKHARLLNAMGKPLKACGATTFPLFVGDASSVAAGHWSADDVRSVLPPAAIALRHSEAESGSYASRLQEQLAAIWRSVNSTPLAHAS